MAKRKVSKKTTNGLDHTFRLIDIMPKTDAQKEVFDAWDEEYNILMHGVAGTGKTFIGLYLAFRKLLECRCDPYKKVIIVRSCVQGRDMGHLPGDPREKMKEYELPYVNITKELFDRGDAYEILKAKDNIQFISTSFLRGATFDNCIVIADEIQNYNFQELDTLITRTGPSTKVIFCGDYTQTDLKWEDERAGLHKFLDIIYDMEDDFEFIEFNVEDIVRSQLVKNYIKTKLKLANSKIEKVK
jgi:phosphate starvation-inducible protein PhoH